MAEQTEQEKILEAIEKALAEDWEDRSRNCLILEALNFIIKRLPADLRHVTAI